MCPPPYSFESLFKTDHTEAACLSSYPVWMFLEVYPDNALADTGWPVVAYPDKSPVQTLSAVYLSSLGPSA